MKTHIDGYLLLAFLVFAAVVAAYTVYLGHVS